MSNLRPETLHQALINFGSKSKPLVDRLTAILDWLEHTSTRFWVLGVLGIALAQRLALLLYYQPVIYNDTPSYRRLANAILAHMKGYDGTRTPGYSLFLAFVGPDQRVWLAQLALGLALTFLFFYMGWQLTGKAWFGGLSALAYTLNPGQIWFESNLLSETLTTFWVTLTFAGLFLWLYHPRARSVFLAVGMGISSSLAWLTRPLFIFLPFWILFFLFDPDLITFIFRSIARLPVIARFIKPRSATRQDFPVSSNESPPQEGYTKHSRGGLTIPWVKLGVFLLPVFLILGSWVGYIHKSFHQWAMDTMTGYHLIQHTGIFFEYVPDEYAGLRDTYLKYRDLHIAQYGTQTNTIWDAIPEMQKVSGLNFYSLSRLLTTISIQLIVAHPDLYIKNLIQGWWYFWRGPVYWSPEDFRLKSVIPLLSALVLFGRLLVFAFNLLFLSTTILAAASKRFRQAWQIPPILWCIVGAVWGTSLLQTFLDHGDNPRFLIPLESFVLLWVLYISLRTFQRK